MMLLGLVSVPMLAARFGKSGALIMGAGLGVVACLGFYITTSDAVGWVFFWGCLIALGGTPVAVLGWAMIPDTVEFAQWKLGIRADDSIIPWQVSFKARQSPGWRRGGSGVGHGRLYC